MRYQTAQAFRAALEERLRQTARQHGQTALTRQRKLVVFDRLAARLLVVAPDRWVVKGGLALDLRLGEAARATRDLDLARQDSEEASTADLNAAQEVDLGDYFTFTIERTGGLDAAFEDAAVRYRVTAELAGRRFEDLIVDVGFGDPLLDAPDTLQGPNLLGFAGIDPVEVPAIPLEQHAAEKLHAYTRTYGEHGSTRVKDLVDLVLIRSAAAFEAGRLRRALRVTFDARGTHDLPPAMPAPPMNWAAPYKRLADQVGLQPDVAIGHQFVAAFLDPILGGSVGDEVRWDPATGSW